MEKTKEELVNELFKSLTNGSDVALELGDKKIGAILSTIAVILYNNQFNLINEVFEHFRKDIFPKVRKPVLRETDAISTMN